MDQTLLFTLESLAFTAILTMVTVVLYILYSIRSRKTRYVERIRELEKQLDLSSRLLEETRKRCEEDVKRLTRMDRPARAVLEALESGLVRLVHEDDGGRVMVLQDGTLVCEKGHLVGGENGPSEHGVDAG